jgi:hypothetical protein
LPKLKVLNAAPVIVDWRIAEDIRIVSLMKFWLDVEFYCGDIAWSVIFYIAVIQAHFT